MDEKPQEQPNSAVQTEPQTVQTPPQEQVPTQTNEVQTGTQQMWTFTSAYTEYNQVPFFRKMWFAIASLLIFTPALLAVLLTGNLYKFDREQNKVVESTPKMKQYLYIAIGVIFILGLTRAL